MRHFTITASLLGGIASFVGFWIAYDKNLPVGPTDVVLLGVVYLLAFLGKKLWAAICDRPSRETRPPL
jgi:ABC-type Mn2+/Zn2+ transport system permease subunit